MAGWRKKQKRPDGSIYMLLPTIIREERVPQSSAARVALRWVGFFGSVLVFFFFFPSVTKCRCSHLITRNLFIDKDADTKK